MGFFGNSPEEEIAWATALEQGRQRAAAAAAAWQQSNVLYASRIAASAPWMNPGTVLALAKTNASPEAVQAAAKLQAGRRAQTPNVQRGERVRGSQLVPGDRRLFSEAARDQARSNEWRATKTNELRERLVSETRQDMAMSLQRHPEQDPVKQLRDSGIIDEAGNLHSPVASTGRFIAEDGSIDENRLQNSGLANDVQQRFRSFVEIANRLSAEAGDIRYIEADDEIGIYDPETRSFYADPSTTFEAVSPFPIREVLQPVTDAVGAAVENIQFPDIGGAFQGVRESQAGGGQPRPGVTEHLATRQQAGLGDVSNFPQLAQQVGMLLNAPVQEFQGQIRNVYGATHGRDVAWWEPQSDAMILAGNPDLDPGSGYLVDPDSTLAQERLDREERRGLIGGQRVTAGRWAASAVVEPGSTPYRVMSGLVDAVVQVADPVAIGAGAVGKGMRARTLFEAAEEVAGRPQIADEAVRGVAQAFGIEGAEALDRPTLIRHITGRAPDLESLPPESLSGAAAALGIEGATELPSPGLVASVKGQLENLNAVTPARVIGPPRAATSVAEVVGRGVAEGLVAPIRLTGLPYLAQRAGLVKGTFMRGVHGPTANFFLGDTPDGTRLLDEIAQTADGWKIDQLTGGKLTPLELRALRDADSPAAVRETLEPLLGKSIPSTRDLWQNPVDDMPIFGQLTGGRWLSDVPGTSIDVDDPRSALTETVAWLRNAHVEDPEISLFFNKMIDANNYDEVFATVEDMMTHTRGVLAQNGVVSRELRNRIATAYRKEMSDAQASFLDEATDNTGLSDEVVVGDQGFPTGSPHDYAAVYNRFIFLPDFRAVRRLTSNMPNIGWNAEGQLRWPMAAAQFIQEDIWKPMTLLRAAWPVRVIGEEQLRMGASGLSSIFHDPLSYLAYAVARRGDVTGADIADAREFQSGMISRTNGFLNERPGRVRTGQMIPFRSGDEGFTQAWASMLVDMHADPLLRRIAEADSLDEVQDWLVSGAGRQVYDRLLNEHPNLQLDDSINLRDFIQRNADWNIKVTSGNDDLMNVIRTGKIGRWDATTMDRLNPSNRLVQRLQSTYADQAPDEVLGMQTPIASARSGVVDRAFSWLMSKPSNYLSRSQAFRQNYWNRVGEMIGFATPEAKAAILAEARKADSVGWGPATVDIPQAPKGVLATMEETAAVGRLTATEVDMYAKGYALDETKRLLYDTARKSQIADSMRIVSPFAEAWKEVVSRWANPRTGLLSPFRAEGWRNLRRYQQVRQGMVGQDFGEVMGAPPEINPDTGAWEQQGFFWKNEYGEDVFLYPGSQWITGVGTELMGEKVPTPLSGSVKGLSMFGEILPGIGPVASIPASWFLPDKPGITRDVREWLLPYGAPSDEVGQSAWTQMLNYAPPWMRRGVQALTGGGYDMETNRLYANTVMSSANYLYSTGQYDTSDQSGRALLLSDAKSAARSLYGIRAFISFGAPSSPRLEFLTRTNDGLVRTAMLRDEYYRMIDEVGYEAADSMFLERFGPQVGMVMQANTRQVTGGVSPTQDFDDWSNSSTGQKLQDLYPAVWGFFGPEGGKFDYDSYVHQIMRGDREALSPQEWLNLGQNHLGQMLLDQVKEQMGPEEEWTEEDRAWKDEMEDLITEEYPGFGDFSGLEQRAERPVVMTQLAEAVKDKRVKDTPVGQALAIYWEARQQVVDIATEMGFKGIDKAKALAEDRAWLYGIGQELVDEYPEFARLWRLQLSHEVDKEEVPT